MSATTEATAPPRELFVYYLRGRPRPAPGWTPAGFVGNWQEEDYSFLFFDRPARKVVDRLVAAQTDLELLDETAMSYEQWQGGRIEPLTVAGLHIVPPWHPAPKDAGPVIVLDPGVVFGNGLHPTTRDCLAAVADACIETPPDRVLDLGTGTGVLALAAARWGARRVLAVDLNPLCVRTTLANARSNRLEGRVLAVQGRAEDFARLPAELMVANLHYDVMRGLLTADVLASKRRVVLSGLLRSEARKVARRLDRLPVRVRRERDGDGIWHTFEIAGEGG